MPTGGRLRSLAGLIAAVLIADLLALATVDRSGGPAASPSDPTSTSTVATTSTAGPTTTAPPPPPRILFTTTDRAGTTSVFEVDPDGGQVVTAAVAPPKVPAAQVSRTRSLIVYSKTISSSSTPYSGCGIAGCTSGFNTVTEAGIAVAALDGSGERLLTKGGYDAEPSFSPDGTRIAFLGHTADDKGQATDEVVVIDPYGQVTAELPPPPGTRYAAPVWHPDGRAITVLRSRLNELSVPVVTVVPTDGSPPTDIASGYFRAMAWSPNGEELAVIRMHYERHPSLPEGHPGNPAGTDLWILPADGSAPRNLTHMAPTVAKDIFFCGASGAVIPTVTSPAWSPEGSRLAFLSTYAHIAEYAGVGDLGVVGRDGSGLRMLYRAPHAQCENSGDRERRRQVTPQTVALLGWTR